MKQWELLITPPLSSGCGQRESFRVGLNSEGTSGPTRLGCRPRLRPDPRTPPENETCPLGPDPRVRDMYRGGFPGSWSVVQSLHHSTPCTRHEGLGRVLRVVVSSRYHPLPRRVCPRVSSGLTFLSVNPSVPPARGVRRNVPVLSTVGH